ncbi:hypothetical protein P148_SR1C00001G0926 [candidate division SR1 bacterium RAAC1_SR1_1]|nr:hypothetical protein P148_SR1C00001G0926 [candidate division SR1 bacterium RAAC1_SR1_1]
MKKPLIVYYSLEGFTRYVAKNIAKKIGADLLEIHPKKEIKAGFMKYLRGGKQVMMKETPELEPYQIDLTNHDIIYIGTPVWAFTFTPAIRSFLKHTHLKSKKIVLFCTHEGGPKKTLDNLEEILLGNTILFKKDFNRRLLEKNEKKLDEEINTILP